MIQQHTDMGTLRLDLTKPMSALPTGTIVASVIGTSTVVVIPTPTGAVTDQQNPMGTPETDIPLSRDEKNIRTHAILMSLGFLVFLPFGKMFGLILSNIVLTQYAIELQAFSWQDIQGPFQSSETSGLLLTGSSSSSFPDLSSLLVGPKGTSTSPESESTFKINIRCGR